VQRRFRLSSSTDIQRVRRNGRSYAHPLLVLIAQENGLELTRIAVIAGRSVGKAVERNRAKRLIREAVRPLLPELSQGWDLLLLARGPLSGAPFEKVQAALVQLLKRAHLLHKDGDGERTQLGT
jgi:ribonuclease P protein component